MRDNVQLLKDIITDINSNGKKKEWRTYSLEEYGVSDRGESCRSRWKNFKKDFYPKGLWSKDSPISEEWKVAAERAVAIDTKISPVVEEMLPDEIPQNFRVSKIYSQQTKDGSIKWLHSLERDKTVDEAQQFYDKAVTAFENIVLQHEPQKIYLPPVKPTSKCLNVLLSDLHIGADIPNSMWGDSYNKEVYLQRIRKVIDRIENLHATHGTFDTISIVVLGDTTDGAGTNKTTRGGHELEQNMDPQDQFDLFVKSFIDLFNTLVKEGFSQNLNFISVCNDNHSGPFGYAGSRAIEIYLNAAYPDVNTYVSKNFMMHFKVGNKTFIGCHGKDERYMRGGFSFNLSKDQIDFVENYIMYNGLNKHVPFNQERNFTFLLVGDLHQSKSEFHRRFTYKRVMSFFGATNWIDFNFSVGSGYKGFEYMLFDTETPDFIEGRDFFL